MKKLIVAAAAALLGIAANAASCNWQIKSDWVTADDENPLVAQVYAFDALAYSLDVVAAALVQNDTTILANALKSGVVDEDGAFLFTGKNITDDGATPAYAKVYNILIANDADDNAFFYATDTKSVKLTDAVLADKAGFVWDEISTGAVGGAGWTAMSENVPEPTSGLLLLLGMAGLALKRKQA